MIKHSPKYLAINQIPHDFRIDLQDKLPEMGAESLKFLKYAIPDPVDQTMLFEYLGYCMTKDILYAEIYDSAWYRRYRKE